MKFSLSTTVLTMFLHICGITSEQDCGQAVEIGLEMAAGRDISIEKAPWIFSILDEDGEVWCGGSVISKTLLLTAGHCLRPGLDLSKFKLVFGEKNPENTDTSSIVKQFTRNNVKFHPEYTYPQAYNDVALIRLKEEDKLSFDGKIRKICLPKETNAEPNK